MTVRSVGQKINTLRIELNYFNFRPMGINNKNKEPTSIRKK
jgi:hypothetical protein